MSIYMVGIDHNKASIDVRSLFSFTKKNAAFAMESIKSRDGILGCIILSTCNRMECWISAVDEWEESLTEILCEIKQVEPQEYQSYFIERNDEEAVNHLFYLTCGLKSQILGEDQILTQVKEALNYARECFTTDNVLEVLFRMAVTAGKKIKTEVVFSRANYTAMDSALDMLKNRGVDLKDMTCMVIGNGEMGKLAAQSLKNYGANVTVTVRQYRSGVVNIPAGCERIDYSQRLEYLKECALVVSATASPNYTLIREHLLENSFTPGLIMIDLAVPRDMDPAIREIQGIELYDIDDFKENNSLRSLNKEAIDQTNGILNDQMKEFYDWLDGRTIIPRIKEIQEQAVQDLNLRLGKIFAKLPLDNEEKQALRKNVDTAAEKVIGKMIYGLRDSFEKDSFEQIVKSMEKVYGK